MMENSPDPSQTLSNLRNRADELKDTCVTNWTLSGMMGFLALATYEVKSAIPAVCAIGAVAAAASAIKDRMDATDVTERADNLELLQADPLSPTIIFEDEY